MKLKHYFSKIFVINLPYKNDRRLRLTRHLKETGLADAADLTWVRAISGDWCPPPAWFSAGNGAWGCLQSHVRIVQDAIMDQLDSFLVLEDDVVFSSHAADELDLLMARLPGDWDQLYLGGQHLKDPTSDSLPPGLFRCNNVNRTHALALSNRVYRSYQQHITHAPDYIARGGWHIDHQLGLAHERNSWNTYAPTWWLAGQDEGDSNISGRTNPRLWWHHHGWSTSLPFVYVSQSQQDPGNRDMADFVHFGNNLKPGTLEDIGLDRCVDSTTALHEWLRMIAREAIDRWKLPGICHPALCLNTINKCWASGVRPVESCDLKSLCNYPYNGLIEAASAGESPKSFTHKGRICAA
jgi:hypothetical protein